MQNCTSSIGSYQSFCKPCWVAMSVLIRMCTVMWWDFATWEVCGKHCLGLCVLNVCEIWIYAVWIWESIWMLRMLDAEISKVLLWLNWEILRVVGHYRMPCTCVEIRLSMPLYYWWICVKLLINREFIAHIVDCIWSWKSKCEKLYSHVGERFSCVDYYRSVHRLFCEGIESACSGRCYTGTNH